MTPIFIYFLIILAYSYCVGKVILFAYQAKLVKTPQNLEDYYQYRGLQYLSSTPYSHTH